MDHPERILSSTPTGQNIPISTIPHLTPHLKTPPGFSYPQHEQGFIQAQPNAVNSNIRDGRLVRNLENNSINLENAIGDASVSNRTQRVLADQNRNIHVHTPGMFNPIKGIDTLPINAPGHILYTRKDQEIAAEMWLKASLDLMWEASGHIP